MVIYYICNMITTQASNTSPANFNILANRLVCDAVDLPPIIDKGAFCWCSFSCVQNMLVFHGNNDNENDKTDFLFYRKSTNDTVVMWLWKDGAQLSELNGSLNGTFYDFGSLYNPNLKGILIDWEKVFDNFGNGNYEVKATSVILGQTYEYVSPIFELKTYNQKAADLTIRMETYHNGYTESSPIDFSGVNWYSQIRMFGQMRDKQPVFTTDNYKDSLREKRQIQDVITNSYTLELFQLTDDLKDVVVENKLLANDIIITDYTIYNNNRYLPTPVYPIEISSLEYKDQRPGVKLTIKFSDKKENIIKRNTYIAP